MCKIKYIPEDVQIVLREVPDEISLSINISNCPHRCVGCHSPYLQEDKGVLLTVDVIDKLVVKNTGISCVCFFGGDIDHKELIPLFVKVRELGLKVAWYSGDDEIDPCMVQYVDYYKIGHYDEKYGPLNSETTNQRMYVVCDGRRNTEYKDITFKFWNKLI